MNEAQIAAIRTQLAVKIRERIDKNQKDYILREQLEYIQEELGDKNQYSDVKHYEEALAKLKADAEVKEKIKKEIARFKTIMGSSSESAVERGYIETLLELPWNKASKDNNDINRAEEILERDHYGLEKVKERIVEYLAVRCLTSKGEAPILCLVGPPGTGKPPLPALLPRPWEKSMCASAWAVSEMRRRFGDIGEPMWAPCREELWLVCARRG